jgi:hypothetical protein
MTNNDLQNTTHITKVRVTRTHYKSGCLFLFQIPENNVFWWNINIPQKKLSAATLEHIIPILSQTLMLIAPAFLAKTQFLARLNRHLKPWSTTLEASTLTNHFPTITVSYIELCTQPQIPLLRHFEIQLSCKCRKYILWLWHEHKLMGEHANLSDINYYKNICININSIIYRCSPLIKITFTKI